VVLALTVEELLNEKIDAYEDKLFSKKGTREPEAQDLYDIYYLAGIINDKGSSTTSRLKRLITEIDGKEPQNMRSLGSLILKGIPPTFTLMMEAIGKVIE
jgi:hypothetical protein